MRAYLFWIILFLSVPSIWSAPFWGVAAYSALNLVRPEMLFWGGRTGADALFFLFSVTFISVFVKYNQRIVKSFLTRETILILWLYLAILVSIVLSEYDIRRVYYYANEIGKLFLFCSLMILTVDSKKKIIRYELVLLLCLVFLGLWGIDQHFRGNVRLEGLGGKAFPDTNGVAAVFVLFFPVALHYVLSGKSKIQKGGGFTATLIMVVLVIFTQSRGGFLGLTAAATLVLMRSKQRIKILSYSILLVLCVSPFISQDYVARLGTINPEGEQPLESSANSRLYLWQAGMMVFADNPLFGTGFMSYPEAKMPYEYRFMSLDPDFRAFIFREKAKKVTHNTYIQLLSDCGVFGATPFYLFLFGTFWQNRKLRRKLRTENCDMELLNLLNAIEAGIIGYSVSIFFIDAVTMVFMPWQIVISAIIRRVLLEQFEDVQRKPANFFASRNLTT